MTKLYEVHVCVLCGGAIEHKKLPDGTVYWTQGENALPLVDGRCCSTCNREKVIPARAADLVYGDRPCG